MTKKFYIFLLFLAIVTVSTFSGRELSRINNLKLEPLVEVITLNFVPNETEISQHQSKLMVGKSYIDFGNALGLKESKNNYSAVSKYGYLGKYQFSKFTIKLLGVDDPKSFLESPELQEKVFNAYVAANKYVLRKEIDKFVGKTMNGTKITESGILAAAHLAGPSNVKTYLTNNGNIRFQDKFGSSIRHFMKQFGGYDTTIIEAKKNPKVEIQLTEINLAE